MAGEMHEVDIPIETPEDDDMPELIETALPSSVAPSLLQEKTDTSADEFTMVGY